MLLLTVFLSLRYTSYHGIGMDSEGALSMRENGSSRVAFVTMVEIQPLLYML